MGRRPGKTMETEMDSSEKKKEYAPEKIPRPGAGPRPDAPAGLRKPRPEPERDGPVFYEIDYSASPVPGVGKFVRRTERVEPPRRDPVRRRFLEMREIARQYRMPFSGGSLFYSPGVQRENAEIFYRQALFMREFEDDFDKESEFSSYFPNYQMMGYDQLRTYFTWRTRVRRGDVRPTSLSYAFLYLYELLHNVGAADPADALEKLTSFWETYRAFDSTVDKYVLRWLADYHIYYTLPHTFAEFLSAHRLTAAYADLARPKTGFAFYLALSGYDMTRSVFFAGENRALLEDGAVFAMERVRETLAAAGIELDSLLFCPAKKAPTWRPFQGALFHPWLRQPDRTVVFSEKDVYLCRDNVWTHSAALATRRGRRLVGYIFRQTEAALRRLRRYRSALKADLNALDPETRSVLEAGGVRLGEVVRSAAEEFYRERTRTVVTVDEASLSRIRTDAAATQEALTVETEEEMNAGGGPPPPPEAPAVEEAPEPEPVPAQDGFSAVFATAKESAGGWDALWDLMDDTERQALAALVSGGTLERFAAEKGILPELLAESVNEKAMETVGDGLLDDALALYPDYEEQVKGMMR